MTAQLKRTMGLGALVIYGVGDMLGAGIYGLIGKAAGLMGHGWPLGHGALVSTLCHQTVSKAETLTNWRARPLRPEQIRYAYDDVRWLLRMHELLDAGLTMRKRTGWFAEEMTRFLTHSLLDAEQSEKWRKLKGISGMTRRQLASVRELSTWREDFASRSNSPSRLCCSLRWDWCICFADGWLQKSNGSLPLPCCFCCR